MKKRAIQIAFLSILSLVSLLSLQAALQSSPRLVDSGIETHDHYKDSVLSKQSLSSFVTSQDYQMIPSNIPYWKQKLTRELDEHHFNCKVKMKAMPASFKEYCRENQWEATEERYAEFWKSKLTACYGMFNQGTPILRFNFDNLTDGEYLLDEVEIKILGSELPMSIVPEKLYAHKNYHKDPAQLIILDTTKAKFVSYKLEQPLEFTSMHEQLRLKLFTEENWNGSFTRRKHILQFVFPFKARGSRKTHRVSSPIIAIDL